MMEFGVAQTPALGEMVCGDSYAVCDDGSTALLAVADGLGHGEHAAVAAVAFIDYVRAHSGAPLGDILMGASNHIAGTRGVAAALVRVDRTGTTLEFAGVGNIAFQCVGPDHIRPVSLPGIVGQRIRKVRPFLYDVTASVLFALCSDGVSTHFDVAEYARLPFQQIASAILEKHSKGYDDATCLVTRFKPEI